MGEQYSVEVCNGLAERFRRLGLHRPMRISRYDAGAEFTYTVTGLARPDNARVRLAVEKFVGGGFAGQVYQVRILDINCDAEPIPGLEVGRLYAMKILVPPSAFSRFFRNALYRVGFQAAFQLQVNPSAARTGALWQKFIRRAAKIRFGDEDAVVDIYATFVDEKIGSCGELSEWVEGRTWRLEVDDRLDLLKRWRRGRAVDSEKLGSAEYRAKKQFMAEFVKLLHEVGACEFGRQYEWSTCKSQPNCLKRKTDDADATAGLVAVDFRAGLALLPFLPMSPGDFALIVKGIARGSLVQFDRGDLAKLEAFVQAHGAEFADMQSMLDKLKDAERIYRSSIPDITHNHIRLFYSGRLWSTMLSSAVTGWRIRNLTDDNWSRKFTGSKTLTLLFCILGILPFLGKVLRRTWARPDWRKHYASILTSFDYLKHSIRGRVIEKAIGWHRAGRVNAWRATKLADNPWRYFCHLPLTVLPASVHRFLTDRQFFTEKLHYIFVRPVRLYFNVALREQWLRDMIAEGQNKQMLSDEDAGVIISRLNEPFIQKYLICLVVHLLTLPVTQIVSVIIAVIYVLTHPEMPRAQAWGIGAGIIALFQVVPVSPGSLVRGLYVVYLVVSERNFKDYNIAVFLGFFKYIGYLAFPIQMTYRYPVLARFMAAHWATEAAHIVPVFGERGALLEHWVFRLFYNRPLTIRRRMRRRAEVRALQKPRYFHVGLCAAAAATALGAVDYAYLERLGNLPGLKDIWPAALLVPLVCGCAVTLGCGGAALGKRIIAAGASGIILALLYTAVSFWLAQPACAADVIGAFAWRVFVFAVLATLAAVVAELALPDPDLQKPGP